MVETPPKMFFIALRMAASTDGSNFCNQRQK